MKTAQELRRALKDIDHRSYPAYKSLAGQYQFGDYLLSIDHVQGDPFAAPSRLSVQISHEKAGFSKTLWDKPHTRIALQDYLTRQFAKRSSAFSFQAKGSGKSGLITVSHPGQEILERTACTFDSRGITARFAVGFPANGRTINAGELEKILFDFLPEAIRRSFYARQLPEAEIQSVFRLAEDQESIRRQLPALGLVAFVADGSILPRESGISDRPMKQAVPFRSPESLSRTLQLPYRGAVSGMGIPAGITLIAGGGYHGKSTLLKALELGVYNHIAGDGREYVITDETALKLRAEDGRKIKQVDISLFIRDLPGGKSTSCFSTPDASGSTSQAANIIEGIEAGSKVFLIDEDTSATNFMVRDDLMQHVIAREKEPIIPFLERARDLYTRSGISSILVVGSCGSYFHIADTILQMDQYEPLDITEKARAICAGYPKPSVSAPHYCLPAPNQRRLSLGRPDPRARIRMAGALAFSLDKTPVELRFVEQLKDSEQTAALACMLKFALSYANGRELPVSQIVSAILEKIRREGLVSFASHADGLAMPRVQEIYACLNRY